VMAKRKLNWSESELLALSDEVASNISDLRLTLTTFCESDSI
jgi:hypothetical protein